MANGNNNGMTRKEVLRLRDKVDDIHEKVHEIDKNVTLLSSNFSDMITRLSGLETSVMNNKIAIAKYTGMGGLGGAVVAVVLKLVLNV